MKYPETIKALKVEMEYTEEPMPTCEECTFCIEQEHPTTERMWVHLCTFHPIGTLPVSENGRCRFFEKPSNEVQIPPEIAPAKRKA